MSNLLWTDKYKPEKLSELAGQKKAVTEIENYISSWKGGKALLLSGHPGIGKTLSIETICKENNWQLVRINASDSRTSDDLKGTIGETSKMKPLFHKKKILLIDEVDGISSTERGATKTLIDIVKKSLFPVIFIANDPWISKLRSLRNHCIHVKFSKIPTPSIEKRLRAILDSEGIGYDEFVLKNLARWSNGDIRSAIIDLQVVSIGEEKIDEDSLMSLGYRERENDMFGILPSIFRSGKISVAKKLIWDADKDADMVFWWLENNIPVEFSDPFEIKRSLDILSKADYFRGLVSKKQNWRFKAYMVDMMAGISVGRREPPKTGWVKYEPPQKIMMMAANKQERAELKEVYQKIGNYTHLSTKAVKGSLLPYLRLILSSGKFAKDQSFGNKEKTANLMAFSKEAVRSEIKKFDISEEEIAIILN